MTSLGRRHPRPKAREEGSVLLTTPGIDVNCKGSLGNQSSGSSAGASQKKRKAVIRKDSAETQGYVSCQDMEVYDDQSFEELGLVQSAVSDSAGWHDPSGPSTCATRSATKRASSFYGIEQPSWWEEGGQPHTPNICRNCYDCRLAEKWRNNRSAVQSGMLRSDEMTSQCRLLGRFRVRRISLQRMWVKKEVGEECGDRGNKKRCSGKQVAAGTIESPDNKELELLRGR